ncbi:MAG: hypothetical protein ABIB71_09655 [Candidatus Woesearchaeota archaeon]
MDIKKKELWLLIPIIFLSLCFIIKLVDQSQMMKIFPLDYTNDMSSYMAQLDFLKKCGYNNFCPYWYNGFTTFKITMPGWYIFAYPLYYLTNNVQITFFVSMITIYVLAFVSIYFLGKLHKLSITKRVALFIFFFANAIAIGNFIRLGRVPELFAWLNFIIIALAALYYKDKKIDKKFLLLIIPTAIVLLSHQTVAILSLLTLASLFFISKERRIIGITIIAALAVTSFWWIPYLSAFGKTAGTGLVLTETLLRFDSAYFAQSIAALVIPLVFIAVFYFCWDKRIRDLLFFLPVLILSVLVFTGLIIYLPLFKYIYPDVYLLYFAFFAIFLLLKHDFSKAISKLIILALISFAIISIIISFVHTPSFIVPGEYEREIVSMLDLVDDKFLVLGETGSTIYSNALYSYASIYYNLSTPGGWYTALITPEYYAKLREVNYNLITLECDELLNTARFLNTSYIIASDQSCEKLESCGLKQKKSGKRACLYLVGENK